MTNFLSSILSALESSELLLFFTLITIIIKLSILFLLPPYISKIKTSKTTAIWLFTALLASVCVSIKSAVSLSVQLHVLPQIPVVTSVLLCISQIANIVYHLALLEFIEHLIKAPPYKISRILRFCIGGVLALGLVLSTLLKTGWIVLGVDLWQAHYAFVFTLAFWTVTKALIAISKPSLPILLKYQLKIFTYIFMLPAFILKFINVNPFTGDYTAILPNTLILCLTSLVGTASIYYCTFRLIGLRFLNAKEHITTTKRYSFVEAFKKVVSLLGQATTSSELRHIVQHFFSETYSIAPTATRLIIQNDSNYDHETDAQRNIRLALGASIDLGNLLEKSRIITRDEIDFSAYYEQQPVYAEAATLLRNLNADALVPIYDKQTLSGFIIIEQNARKQKFFSGTEQDEMAVFAAYLSSVINLIRNRSLDSVLAKEKQLEEELFHKHQEINHYKESIRSFLRESHEKKIGILFYRNNKFSLGNQAAQALIACDPNMQQGHPVSQALKKLAQQAEQYKSVQTSTITPSANKVLAITALPSLERTGVIVIVTHPDVSDIINLQTNVLKDPSHWDYLLYLETTESGRMVNRLIPGKSATLLNFKIDLLGAALSRNAALISGSKDDQIALVNLLHTISLRKQLVKISLKEPEQNLAQAMALFGLPPLLGAPTQALPILEQLNGTGTLFIEGVHLLALETQKYLAEFLRYGSFRRLKGDHRYFSDVRVICSSNHDLTQLANKGLFSSELLQELRRSNLAIPVPEKLSRAEFDELVAGISTQLTAESPFKNMLILDEREITLLFEQKFQSIDDLKKRVHALILSKSQAKKLDLPSTNLTSDDIIDLHNGSPDEELNKILLLGKKALKDRAALTYLWNKFKSQTKIATLLNVNRSSVNRRCKEFELS
ncbi:TPA: hypothetical protein DDZ86_03155 [Candidatus Dependentiae bacterium]|nr:MAG: Two component, sigma54 specific, transcriptional regulator, Fis family [candidate division TM6 bacterium GW2011_GWF2_43_87]HBL98614.1 hypothetical protein [Candidatus Dependentiae bacterium]